MPTEERHYHHHTRKTTRHHHGGGTGHHGGTTNAGTLPSSPRSPPTSPRHKTGRCRTCTGRDGSHSRSCSHHHHHHHTSRNTAALNASAGTPALLLLVFLLLSSLVFLAVGIWLLASRFGWPAALDFMSNKDWTRFLSIGFLIFVTGILLLIAFIVGILLKTAPTRNLRSCSICALSSLLVLLAILAIMCLAFGISSVAWVSNWLGDGWTKTVATTPSRLCDYQRSNKCYGFEDGSCRGCDVTTGGAYTAGCSEKQREVCPICVVDRDIVRSLDVFGLAEGSSTDMFMAAAIKATEEREVARSGVAFVSEDGPAVRMPVASKAAVSVRKGDFPAVTKDAGAGLRAAVKTSEVVITETVVVDSGASRNDGGAQESPEATMAPPARPPTSGGGGIIAGGTTGGGTTSGGGGTGGTDSGGERENGSGAGLFAAYAGNGCKNSIRQDFREFMIPWAVASVFVLLLVLIMLLLICCATVK